jgi:excisionase family DNA binding protein
MPRTRKPKPAPLPQSQSPPAVVNGSSGDVLTLAEAAAYLRLPEADVVRLVHSQSLPGRFAGSQWRFLKSAIQDWLSKSLPPYNKEGQLSVAGLLKDDPDLVPMVEKIYRRRRRPITEDGSYNLLHGLEPGSGKYRP